MRLRGLRTQRRWSVGASAVDYESPALAYIHGIAAGNGFDRGDIPERRCAEYRVRSRRRAWRGALGYATGRCGRVPRPASSTTSTTRSPGGSSHCSWPQTGRRRGQSGWWGGLRRALPGRYLPLADVQIQPDALGELLFLGVLRQHRFEQLRRERVVVALKGFETAFVYRHGFKVGRSALRRRAVRRFLAGRKWRRLCGVRLMLGFPRPGLRPPLLHDICVTDVARKPGKGNRTLGARSSHVRLGQKTKHRRFGHSIDFFAISSIE